MAKRNLPPVTPEEREPSRLSRREVLARLSSAGLAAAGVTLGAFAFADRRAVAAGAARVRDFRAAGVPVQGRGAVVARGDDPAANVARALAAMGGMGAFVKRGETVLVKPNVGWDRLPAQGANTDPAVVAELVRQAKAAGARKVVVADISCNDPRRCFARSGIEEAAKAAGAEVLTGRDLELVPVALAGAPSGLPVMRPVLEADRVINVPVVKHHSLSQATIGMKNWFGLFSSGRNRMHQDIDRSLAELCAAFRPTLTVIDATRVLLRNGPQGGSLADVKAVGAVAAGLDPVLLDAWGATLLGLDPRQLGFVTEAERAGLGHADLAAVKELGKA